GRPPRAVEIRITGEYGDRPAVEAGHARHGRASVTAPDLEEGIAIDDGVDDVAHLVHLSWVSGDRVDQPVLPARRVVGRVDPGRGVVDRAREVRQECARSRERLVLAADDVVDGAVAAVDGAAAELLLVDLLAEPGDHGWTGHKQLRRIANHDRVVARDDPGRAQAGD